MVDRHWHERPLALHLESGRLREFESRAQLVRRLFEPPTAHSYPQNNHLRGERLTRKGAIVLVIRLNGAWEDLDSTQNTLQT